MYHEHLSFRCLQQLGLYVDSLHGRYWYEFVKKRREWQFLSSPWGVSASKCLQQLGKPCKKIGTTLCPTLTSPRPCKKHYTPIKKLVVATILILSLESMGPFHGMHIVGTAMPCLQQPSYWMMIQSNPSISVFCKTTFVCLNTGLQHVLHPSFVNKHMLPQTITQSSIGTCCHRQPRPYPAILLPWTCTYIPRSSFAGHGFKQYAQYTKDGMPCSQSTVNVIVSLCTSYLQGLSLSSTWQQHGLINVKTPANTIQHCIPQNASPRKTK